MSSAWRAKGSVRHHHKGSSRERRALGETSKDPSVKQELLVVKKQLEAILARLSRLDVMESRLEHAIPFITDNFNRLVGSQSVYLGVRSTVTFLRHGLATCVDTRRMAIGILLSRSRIPVRTGLAVYGKYLASEW